jgi:D-alanyl-D-alanine dipeptidase
MDLSLYDLRTGREVEMPSAYDEMSARAYPDYAGGSAAARGRRDLLRRVMEQEGFSVEPNEWWHFNYRDWREYPILDIPFNQIRPGAMAERVQLR